MTLTPEEKQAIYKEWLSRKENYDEIALIEMAADAVLAKLSGMKLPPLPKPSWNTNPEKPENGCDWYTKGQLQTFGCQAFAQGAASQLAEKPMGWFVKEHGDIVDIEWNSQKPTYEGDWRPLFTRKEPS